MIVDGSPQIYGPDELNNDGSNNERSTSKTSFDDSVHINRQSLISTAQEQLSFVNSIEPQKTTMTSNAFGSDFELGLFLV